MGISADVHQLIEVAVKYDRGAVRVGAMLAVAVRKSTFDGQRVAQINAPVDTGFLKGSITTTFEGDGRSGSMTGEWGPTAEYGRYVNDGTWKMAPRPYMDKSADAVIPNFVTAVTMMIDQGLA